MALIILYAAKLFKSTKFLCKSGKAVWLLFRASLPASYDPHWPRAPPFHCLPDSRPGGIGLWPALPLHCQLKFVRSPPCWSRPVVLPADQSEIEVKQDRPIGEQDSEVGSWEGLDGEGEVPLGVWVAPSLHSLAPNFFSPIKMVRALDICYTLIYQQSKSLTFCII